MRSLAGTLLSFKEEDGIHACPQLLTCLRTACPTIHDTRIRVLLPAVGRLRHQRLILMEPVGLYLTPRPTMPP
jgi:hypothetical protein